MQVQGHISAPGDKSITHRLLLLAGLARGRSRIRGALTSLDARSSAGVLRRLGVTVTPIRPGREVLVLGSGRLRRPREILHCGNSGTTARLLLGADTGVRPGDAPPRPQDLAAGRRSGRRLRHRRRCVYDIQYLEHLSIHCSGRRRQCRQTRRPDVSPQIWERRRRRGDGRQH